MLGKKRVLITGSRGLLGSTLRMNCPKFVEIVKSNLDVTSRKQVAIFSEINPHIDYIIHTAAVTDVGLCEKNRNLAFSVNFEGTKNIIELAKKGSSRLIYISTASVFDGEKGNYKEKDLPYPKSYYDLTKYLGELAILDYPKGLIVRTGLMGIHSKKSTHSNFLDWLLESSRKNRGITLYNDIFVNPLSNFTLSEIIFSFLKDELNERIIHVGTKDTLSKAEIGEIFYKKIGERSFLKSKVDFKSIDEVGGYSRPKQMWLNISRIKKLTGLKMPTISSEINKILKLNEKDKSR